MLKIVFFFAALSLATARKSHFYRKDYTYIEDFDANYKVHWDKDGVSWDKAFMACDDEGAQLFYPMLAEEWKIIKTLIKNLPQAPNTTDVIVGIQNELGQGEFATVDGGSTPSALFENQPALEGQSCVIFDMETEVYRPEPCTTEPITRRIYVCKKVDEKLCPTIDLGYKYSKENKKCYKLNTREKTWQEASNTCFMEGGLLVTPESDSEAEALKSFIPYYPNSLNSDYFIGFRKIPGRDFFTVKGRRLKDAGFQRWFVRDDAADYSCGVILLSNNEPYIRTRNCDVRLPFVCEMQARA